jgi:hypothetical protein
MAVAGSQLPRSASRHLREEECASSGVRSCSRAAATTVAAEQKKKPDAAWAAGRTVQPRTARGLGPHVRLAHRRHAIRAIVSATPIDEGVALFNLQLLHWPHEASGAERPR